jgi:hypothetical protein
VDCNKAYIYPQNETDARLAPAAFWGPEQVVGDDDAGPEQFIDSITIRLVDRKRGERKRLYRNHSLNSEETVLTITTGTGTRTDTVMLKDDKDSQSPVKLLDLKLFLDHKKRQMNAGLYKQAETHLRIRLALPGSHKLPGTISEDKKPRLKVIYDRISSLLLDIESNKPLSQEIIDNNTYCEGNGDECSGPGCPKCAEGSAVSDHNSRIRAAKMTITRDESEIKGLELEARGYFEDASIPGAGGSSGSSGATYGAMLNPLHPDSEGRPGLSAEAI